MTDIVGRAPGRICLLGDNVDLIEKPALAAAISAFLTVSLRKRADRRVVLAGEDIGAREEFDLGERLALDTPLKYAKAVLLRLQDHIDTGFEAVIRSQIPISAGLSSSTALCIGFIDALNQAYRLGLSRAEVAELSFVIEKDDLDIECGRMDQYAIAFGGVTYIDTGPHAGVEKIEVPALPIVVGDTLDKHDTQQIQKWLRERIRGGDRLLIDSLHRVCDIVEQGRQALIAADLERFGRLMTRQQSEEKLMGTSTARLEAFCAAAMSAGAVGAKQMGAGGGGCMIALCPGTTQTVQAAIQQHGGTAWAFDIYHG